MPTQIDYRDSGIFYAAWSDPLTMKDVAAQTDHILGYATEHEVGRFVVIIDLSQCTRIPMEVSNMRNYAMSDPRIVGYVVVRIHVLAQLMLRMLDRLTPQQYVTVDSADEALARARAMLAREKVAG